jgi:hypothetical protein
MADLLIRLYDLANSEEITQSMSDQGIKIRRAMAYEKIQIVEWVKQKFGVGWAGECDVAFANSPISCFIATKEGALCGFACYDSTCKNFFGPTGVEYSLRGLGIGKALLFASLNAMAQAGYAYAIVGGVGPVDFYARTVGAVVIEGSEPGIYIDKLKG